MINNCKLNIKNKSGIYKITNTVNGRIYVGRSTNLYLRYYKHNNDFINKRCSTNKSLIEDVKKYGLEKFLFDVLEFCEKNCLSNNEVFWIKRYNTLNPDHGYNMRCDIHGWTTVSEEFRRNISKSISKKWTEPEYKEKVKQSLRIAWSRNPERKIKQIENNRLKNTKWCYLFDTKTMKGIYHYSDLEKLKIIKVLEGRFYRSKGKPINFDAGIVERISI